MPSTVVFRCRLACLRGWLATLSAALALSGCGGGGGGSATVAAAVTSGSGDTTASTTTTTSSTDPCAATTSSVTPTAVVIVGSTSSIPAGATHVSTLQAVSWSTLAPGTQVRIAPGTYTGVVTISGAAGTQALPITVVPLDTNSLPVLEDSVDFQSSAWVQISQVIVNTPTYAGFIIRTSSAHIQIADSQVRYAPIGINITSAAGVGHKLLRNVIDHATTQGINLEVNSDASDRTLVQCNEVRYSGQHGIEVRASHYQIDRNVVWKSGQNTAGTSGIHIYSGSASEDSGDDNWVRWNLSYSNDDGTTHDGNGIQADQWCDSNLIAYNVTWNNDGAGILLYDAQNNVVRNNTSWSDMRDSGGTHVAGGGIAITTSAGTNRASGNTLSDNIMVSTHSAWPALYLSTDAVSLGNTVGPNLFYNSAAGLIARWGDSQTLSTASQINATSGISGNLVASPTFVDTSSPTTGGLALAARPSLSGVSRIGEVDRAGVTGVSGMTWFGAYFFAD